jgi:hypothetical protein
VLMTRCADAIASLIKVMPALCMNGIDDPCERVRFIVIQLLLNLRSFHIGKVRVCACVYYLLLLLFAVVQDRAIEYNVGTFNN